MDREAWRAAIHGVSKSRTRLSDWTELKRVNLKSSHHKHKKIVTIYNKGCQTDLSQWSFHKIYKYWTCESNVILQFYHKQTYINMNPPRVYTCSPTWNPLPPPSPYHPFGSSQCTSPKQPVSCIKPGLAIHFLHDIIHVSMPFSQIIPLSPFPSESKSLFYTSLSLLLSRIQGCPYHLSKFHIYVLVYSVGVFLSGLLHSV